MEIRVLNFKKVDGNPQIVTVDDYIPVDASTGKPCFAKPLMLKV